MEALAYHLPLTAEIVLVTTKMQGHVQLRWETATTQVVYAHYLPQFTTAIRIQVALVKIGAQGQTGLACHGATLTTTYREVHLQADQTTSGIQMRPRLFYRSLMKDQKMGTRHNKPTTSTQSVRLTIVA